MNRRGYVDLCLQSHVTGWATEDGNPAVLEIFVNDRRFAKIKCDFLRPGLAEFNIPPAAGFFFPFPSPLTIEDEVAVRFCNGEHLEKSPTRQHARHLGQMLHGITVGHGIELGALDRPLVSRDQYQIHFVDHASREGLVAKYQHGSDISLLDPKRIVHVDYVWPGGALADVVGDRRFSWALASGVIEHIGDPIEWLAQIASVLEENGRINLAIPDKTLTFDKERRLTTPAELLDDHFRRLRKPSFRQIFDHISGVVAPGSPLPDQAARLNGARHAYEVAQIAERDGLYVDVHCHVWTRESWIECWNVIEALNLLPLRMDRLFETLPETGMFIVSLVRV